MRSFSQTKTYATFTRHGGWMVAMLLLGVVIGLTVRGTGETPAYAQSQPLAGARGVFAFPIQYERDQTGLAMFDVDQGVIWCYEFTETDGVRKMQLVAAREFNYDRYLRDFNNAGLTYEQVRELVSKQRRGGLSGSLADQSRVDDVDRFAMPGGAE